MLHRNTINTIKRSCSSLTALPSFSDYYTNSEEKPKQPEIHCYEAKTSICSELVKMTLLELDLEFNKIPIDIEV